jgi:DNA phosphorothioation-associated putative methyltransferase
MKAALEKRIIAPGDKVLDFGCGRGKDVEELNANGYQAIGFDPYWRYRPQDIQVTPIVTCIYVINVIESPVERQELIRFLWSITGRTLVIAVRYDGVGISITTRDTYQIYYKDASFLQLVKESLPGQNMRFIKPGILAIC